MRRRRPGGHRGMEGVEADRVSGGELLAVKYAIPLVVIAFSVKAYVFDPYGDLLIRYTPAAVLVLGTAVWLALVVSRWRAGDYA